MSLKNKVWASRICSLLYFAVRLAKCSCLVEITSCSSFLRLLAASGCCLLPALCLYVVRALNCGCALMVSMLDLERFSMHSSEGIKIRVVLTGHTIRKRSWFLEYVNSILKEVISKIILIIDRLWNLTNAASSWSHLRKPFLSVLTSVSHLMAPAELFSSLIVFLYFYLLNYS